MFYLRGCFLVFISFTLMSCFSLLSSLGSIKPAFWLAKKGENKLYILGTVHYGVSIDDLKCSKKIKKYLKTSNLLFSEVYQSALDPKNLKVQKKYFLGALKEKEAFSKQLSEDKKKTLKKNQDNQIDLILLFIYNTKNISFNKEDKFENLNESSQHFLKENGFYNPNKNYLDYMKDILTQLFYKEYFKLAFLDVEILNLAVSHGKTVQTLDTDLLLKDALSSLQSQKIFQNKKIQVLVTAELIDNLIKNRASLSEEFKSSFFNRKTFKMTYKNWKKIKDGIGYDSLLKTRNEYWLNRILTFLKKKTGKTVFIAGGVAHFVSIHNILDMLVKEGFTVQLINPTTCSF